MQRRVNLQSMKGIYVQILESNGIITATRSASVVSTRKKGNGALEEK